MINLSTSPACSSLTLYAHSAAQSLLICLQRRGFTVQPSPTVYNRRINLLFLFISPHPLSLTHTYTAPNTHTAAASHRPQLTQSLPSPQIPTTITSVIISAHQQHRVWCPGCTQGHGLEFKRYSVLLAVWMLPLSLCDCSFGMQSKMKDPAKLICVGIFDTFLTYTEKSKTWLHLQFV